MRAFESVSCVARTVPRVPFLEMITRRPNKAKNKCRGGNRKCAICDKQRQKIVIINHSLTPLMGTFCKRFACVFCVCYWGFCSGSCAIFKNSSLVYRPSEKIGESLGRIRGLICEVVLCQTRAIN